jgi:hypothetical protein
MNYLPVLKSQDAYTAGQTPNFGNSFPLVSTKQLLFLTILNMPILIHHKQMWG